MLHAPPHAAGRVFVLVAAAGLSACAAGLPEVSPVDVPRLEQEVAASPGDTDLQVQLGMAQFKAADFEAARSTLQGAIEAGDESGAAFLYLGMANEELEDWTAARAAYTRYLNQGASAPARAEVRKRLTLIGRNLLRAQARQALVLEDEITATSSVTPRSVAVLPMAFNSDNVDLEPLIYALSDMMVTDFKVSNALVVLERAQIQSLLNEMALTSAGYAEPGTGARAGRLLRAEHVFQGVLTTLGESDLQTDADVLNVLNAESAGAVTESAVLEALFDMEKRIVIRTIREVLGVELTPAEEQAILENRWSNILAFVAYGRGLRELDNGNYAAAMEEFQSAASLEPGSVSSLESSMAEASALIDASQTGTDDLGSLADDTGETGGGLVAPPSAATIQDESSAGIPPPPPVGAEAEDQDQSTSLDLGFNTLRGVAEGIDPTPTTGTLDLGSAVQGQDQTTQTSNDTVRDPVQESTNEDGGVTPGVAQIRIVIRRPGGAQ